MSAGPMDPFNHAVSFVLGCDTQEEVDRLWDALLDGGTAEQCGWLRDRYGVCWQVVPRRLGELMAGPDRARAARVATAMLRHGQAGPRRARGRLNERRNQAEPASTSSDGKCRGRLPMALSSPRRSSNAISAACVSRLSVEIEDFVLDPDIVLKDAGRGLGQEQTPPSSLG